jgi:hypothetical protein
MTRPAVVIGLGGTGQWVVTYVKRDLQETYGDKLPDNVKLLVFDTEVLPAARASTGTGGKVNIGGKEMDEQTYRAMFGNVALDEKEYKHLGGNVQKFCEGIRKGEHPHIERWFDAKWFIENQPQAIFTLRDGAAAWRQFGRLAAFYDLQNRGGSVLWNSIRSAVDAVATRDRDETGASRGVEVTIVSSIVGGTGAGMAIDIANLVREAARDQPITLRGLFVLPKAFGIWQGRDDDSTKKQARAFAMWREMDRFRILGGATGGLPIDYTTSHRRVLDKPLFDAVYLVGGERRGAQSAMNPPGRPELHVYPMLADFVNVLLDGKAGQEFTSRALNLPALDDNPQTPKYSAVGTYSLKSPVHYVMREQTTRFAQTFLREWLQLVPDAQRPGLYSMATNQNKEGGNFAGRNGRDAAVDFLSTSNFRWVDPENRVREAHATLFPAHIKAVVTVHQQAQAELTDRLVRGAAVGDLWPVFTDLRETGTSPLQDELEQALGASLVGIAPSSRDSKEDPADAPSRLDSVIPPFINENFGGVDTTGAREETGKFGRALDRLRGQQMDRFRQSLQVFLLKILMGDSSDAKEARSGKAGFVRDFLEGLLLALNNYTTMLNTVEEKRQRAGFTLTLTQDVQDARRRMLEHAGDKWPIINSPKPSAYNSQEDYLGAVQAQIDGRKDDLFYRAVRQTTEAMRKFVRTTLDNFMQLHDTLVGNADVGVEGLYVELERNLDRVSSGRSRESRELGQIQRVYELTIDTKVREEMLGIALGTLEWMVAPTPEGDSFIFNVSFRPFAGDNANPTRTPLVTKGNNRNSQNVETLLNFSAKAYEPIWTQNRISQLLMEEYRGRPKELVAAMYERAEPLYTPASRGDNFKERSQWVRLQRVGNVENEFFDAFEKELRERESSLTKGTKVIESEDPYRLTLVRTNDLMSSDSFSEYEESLEEYQKVAQKYAGTFGPEVAGHLLHAFSAEANALALELQIMEAMGGKKLEPLHPMVVAGLEDLDRGMDFLFALLFGYIWEEQEGDSGNYYALRLPYLQSDGTLDHNNYGRTLWLSKPKKESVDHESTALFRAFANFGALGQDYNEGAGVDYKRVREVLRAAVKERDATEVREKVLQMLEASNGLVKTLRRQAFEVTNTDSRREQTEREREYDAKARYDLARVVVLLMLRAARNTYRIDLGLGTGGDYRTRITQLLQNR